ncbi:MAG: hypothetical protein ABS87_00910 [Sphingomonas sp. SCN 67-18]|nr:hypothetical protein [Sphingomonas sp. SCN 67-18]ODU22758.1 MAG: hypothetical protein ABS87_00910 [Sphingomonas sp. SCN 67-18]
MAIAQDTAALVAAQLTAAWASRRGPEQRIDPSRPIEAQILNVYLRFKDAVAEVDIGGLRAD